eukprot:scaffold267803_cov37-Tisochrysis_lutea.AAC.3
MRYGHARIVDLACEGIRLKAAEKVPRDDRTSRIIHRIRLLNHDPGINEHRNASGRLHLTSASSYRGCGMSLTT